MILQMLIICPLVFLAGFVDAIAGGGGLISLPAYMIAGLPTHAAIGTNKVSSAMGTSLSTYKYWKDGFIPMKIAAHCILFAFAGSFIGSNVALMISDRYFKMLMLVIVPIVAFYVMRGKTFDKEYEPYPEKKTIMLCRMIALTVGIYDGFYGPGTGTFLILLLTGVAHMKVTEANGTTKAINLATNYASVVVYLTSGTAIVAMGLVAGLFNIAGNYLGASYFAKHGAKSVKAPMLIVLGIFFIKIISELMAG